MQGLGFRFIVHIIAACSLWNWGLEFSVQSLGVGIKRTEYRLSESCSQCKDRSSIFSKRIRLSACTPGTLVPSPNPSLMIRQLVVPHESGSG